METTRYQPAPTPHENGAEAAIEGLLELARTIPLPAHTHRIDTMIIKCPQSYQPPTEVYEFEGQVFGECMEEADFTLHANESTHHLQWVIEE